MKIPLFDIDWTLLKGGNKIHLDAFDFIFKKIYQTSAQVEEINYNGMIDSQIIIETLKKHHLSVDLIKKRLPEGFKKMSDYFLKHIKTKNCIPLPGAREILKELKKRKVLIGVLTGNIDKIGWEKLKRAKLARYIDFGVFGNMAFQRKDLVPLALEKAKEILKTKVFLKDLVIIGDSLRDVLCAKESEIEVIGVASGKNQKEELKSVGADLVVDSLLEKEKIFNYLGV
jgi:phosphoglycolate phosphatase